MVTGGIWLLMGSAVFGASYSWHGGGGPSDNQFHNCANWTQPGPGCTYPDDRGDDARFTFGPHTVRIALDNEIDDLSLTSGVTFVTTTCPPVCPPPDTVLTTDSLFISGGLLGAVLTIDVVQGPIHAHSPTIRVNGAGIDCTE